MSRLWIVLLLLLPMPALGGRAEPLSAQSPGYAAVHGRVEDASGRPVTGAYVTLRNQSGEIVAERRAARDGSYRFGYLEPGMYRLRVEELGYRPALFTGIDVVRGAELVLTAVLEPAATPAGPVEAVEVPVSRVPGAGQHRLEGRRLCVLPYPRDDAADLHLEHTRATSRSVEGLPAEAVALHLGGAAPETSGGAGPSRPLGLPLDALAGAAWRSLPDVEFDAPAGVALDLGLRRGDGSGARATARVARPGLLEADREGSGLNAWAHGSYDARWAGGASLFTGVAWRQQASPWLPSPTLRASATAVAEAATRHGVTLDPELPFAETQAVSLFGRLDVPLTRDGHLRTQLLVSDHSRSEVGGWASPVGTEGPGRRALLQLDVGYPLGRRVDSRTLVAFSYTGDGAARERTALGALGLGARDLEDTRFGISATQSFHARRGAHRLKAGGSVDVLRIDADVEALPGPSFRFADADALAARRGLYASTSGGPTRVAATLPRLALFAQDVWRLSPAFQVLLGARLLLDVAPVSEIDLQEQWYFATGMANTAVDRWMMQVEPRLGVEWSPGGSSRTRAYAAAGLFHDRIDPRALVELIGNDGELAVRRRIGDLLRWPDAPASGTTAGRLGLSVPGADFQPPRTLRVHGGLEREVAGGRLGLELVARHTDRLLVRSDAHRSGAPWGTDQYGRAVWAPPVAVDGLLAPSEGWAPVPEFDHVWRLESAGTSTFYGATVSGSLRPSDGLMVVGSYTLSRTRDNWPVAEAGGAGSAPPPGLGDGIDEQWLDGVADYDVPHQLLLEAIATLSLPARPVAGVRFRMRSGLPFTPGYLRGLDYNADGLPGDPAYIDPDLPGMAPLLSEWDCLRESAGGVATRNSCRGAATRALDATLHLTLLEDRATLLVEALDVLASGGGLLDSGLYRLDRTRELVFTGSEVALPLTVNPEFGSVLVDTRAGPRLRLGLNLSLN